MQLRLGSKSRSKVWVSARVDPGLACLKDFGRVNRLDVSKHDEVIWVACSPNAVPARSWLRRALASVLSCLSCAKAE